MGKLLLTIRAPILNGVPKYQKGSEQVWATIQTRQANYTSRLAWEQCATMCVKLCLHAQSITLFSRFNPQQFIIFQGIFNDE